MIPSLTFYKTYPILHFFILPKDVVEKATITFPNLIFDM